MLLKKLFARKTARSAAATRVAHNSYNVSSIEAALVPFSLLAKLTRI